jgi:hypothetical protein
MSALNDSGLSEAGPTGRIPFQMFDSAFDVGQRRLGLGDQVGGFDTQLPDRVGNFGDIADRDRGACRAVWIELMGRMIRDVHSIFFQMMLKLEGVRAAPLTQIAPPAACDSVRRI